VRRIAVIDAPSNLGLRPPTATSVPGCAKAPGALRDHNLLGRLGARDAGCITPPRYDPAGWQPGDGVAQAAEISVYVRRLADRIGTVLGAGDFPLVLGGDCSILLGAGLAMRRYQTELGGRIGLVYVDGHSDFRHEGNASYVGAAAGEALALATGRGQANLASIEQRRPYFRDVDVALLGIRTHDEYRLDLQAAGIVARAVPELRSDGAARSAQWARDQLRECAGFWVHVDVDVLDPAVMPAVDAPDVGGIAYRELEILLSGLISDPRCVGAQVTVFDPDYDPDGQYAAEVADVLVAGLEPLITSAALVAASPDPVISAPPFAAPVSAPPVSAPPLITPPVSAPPLITPRVPSRAAPAPSEPPVSAPPLITPRVPARAASAPSPSPSPDPDRVVPSPSPSPASSDPDRAAPSPSPVPSDLDRAGSAPSPLSEPSGPAPSDPVQPPAAFDPMPVAPVSSSRETFVPAGASPSDISDISDMSEDGDHVNGGEGPPPATGEDAEVAGEEAEPVLARPDRVAALSLDSLPRDNVGPGGLRPHAVEVGAPFVPAQAVRRALAVQPESPLTDVVPAARTPVDEEEPAG
jgi:arginase